MKTFEDYYKKELNKIAKYAKRDDMSVNTYINKNYRRTIIQFKAWHKTLYRGKDCHSFWHRECTNKGVECHRCLQYYSAADWDKMSTKEKNNIKNN